MRKETEDMVDPAIKEQILSELDRLSPALQRRALEMVHSLNASSSAASGASLRDLLSIAGTLDKQSAREMREAIEEHCERVDLHEW